jgi:hypothetical protein
MLTWAEMLDRVFAMDITLPRRRRIAVRCFEFRDNPRNFPNFTARWIWLLEGRVGPPPLEIPPLEFEQQPFQPANLRPEDPRPLGALARDTQNVHTRFVTDQTNRGMEKILKVNVPKGQDTRAIITMKWLTMPEGKKPAFNTYFKVMQDIQRWFNEKTCRTNNDQLYYRLLRGVVTMINEKGEELQNELYARLWEECYESVGMCCDGHITRLCNVFVGFDDEFRPSVPFGEILQNKMASIAGLDVDEEEKRRQATVFFDEYAVPQEERVAWLEAF